MKDAPVDLLILAYAGISASEFSQLAQVSRSTVFNWIHHNKAPSKLAMRQIQPILLRIERLVDDERLPLPTMACLPGELHIYRLRALRDLLEGDL